MQLKSDKETVYLLLLMDKPIKYSLPTISPWPCPFSFVIGLTECAQKRD